MEKKRICSRQQRTFERRSKIVTEKEKEKWKLVQPVMMSEEEEEGDQPSWSSEEFNNFLDMLDERYSKKDPKTKAKAFSRKLGEVVVREPQVLISDRLWMTSEDCLSESYPEELET